jgi:hypothetical protein
VQSDSQDARDPSVSLLVRRVGVGAVDLARLLPSPAGEDLERLALAGGLFVLADLAAAPSTAPLAVAAFDKDRGSRRARLVLFSACPHLAQRLLEGAFTLLRSEGIEGVEADAGETYSVLLQSLGFTKGPGANLLYWL